MITVVTPAASEPVTTAEVKTHLRVDASTEDTYLETLIEAARATCEGFTQRALVDRTIDYSIDRFPCERFIVLPFGRVSSITSVTYLDSDGGSNTFAPSNYFIAQTGGHARLHLASGSYWPTATLRPAEAVTIRLTCGYGDAAAVPAMLKHGIKICVADLYEHRESYVAEQGVTIGQIPRSAENCWWPYKIVSSA